MMRCGIQTQKEQKRRRTIIRGVHLVENIIVQNVGITMMMITYIPMMEIYGITILKNL